MRYLILLASMSIVCASCKLGKNAAKFPVAHTAAGAIIQVRTASQHFDAELLEVRSNGILVAKNGQIALVPWTSTQLVSVKGLGREYKYGRLTPPARDVLPNLVKVSHFPQGMTPDIEARLLASRGQKEIVVIQ